MLFIKSNTIIPFEVLVLDSCRTAYVYYKNVPRSMCIDL